MMVEGVITFKHNSPLKFFDYLQNCWQPTAVHKSDVIIHLHTFTDVLRKREVISLQNRNQYFVSDHDVKQS